MIHDFNDVLLLILGWLLGTLSPSIERAILRQRQRSELLKGLNYEAYELRFTLANLLYSTRRDLLELDQKTLDLIKPILIGYTGPMDTDLVAGLKKVFDAGDAALLQWANNARNQKKDRYGRPLGAWPVPYSLPLLGAHIGSLDLLAIDQQEAFLRVDAELKLFNEQVQYVRHLQDQTFSSTGVNHQLTEENLVGARRNLGIRAAVLIQAINRAAPL